MRGKGVLRQCSLPRGTRSAGKKMKSCKGSLDDVVVFDVDRDEIVIIGVRKSLRKKLDSSSVLEGIITIDDEDDDDNSDNVEYHETNSEGSNASSSKSSSVSHRMKKSPDVGLDGQPVTGKTPEFKSSRCGATCGKKVSPGNHYGLSSDSESDPSESDSSDCEVIEGPSRELREKWEKASVKRKSKAFRGHPDHDDHVGPSGSFSDMHPNDEVEHRRKQGHEAPGCSSSGNAGFVNSSGFTATEGGSVDGGFCVPNSDEEVDLGKFPRWRTPCSPVWMDSHRNADVLSKEKIYADLNFSSHGFRDMDGCRTRFQNEREFPQGTCSTSYPGGVVHQTGPHVQDSEQNPVDEDSFPSFEHLPNLHPDNGKDDIHNDDASLCKLQNLGETHNVDQRASPEASSFSALKEPVSGSKCHTCKGNPLNAPPGGLVMPAEGDIINEREKLKETDEYKRAIEEEWAARERQLKLQAEEAQRLKKRKKAESLRILDMEKRQRQRLQEVRETQKKDEEHLNMKENFRAEIQKELNKLEVTCFNMESLLRGLGIHVGGGLSPSSDEVHAAYKRALFKFHPDRASRTDIRQQVEAEEKFKLISRMKEKFLTPACY